MPIRAGLNSKLNKLKTNRGVVLLLGFVGFVTTCFTFSPTSAVTPQVFGFVIYFLFGLLLSRLRSDLFRMVIFFLPFSIWIVVSLTNNPGLFPDVVPLLVITCVTGFYAGAFLITTLHSRKKVKIAALIMVSVLYLFIVTRLIVPAIIFDRLSEPLPSTQLTKNELKFINHLADTVVVKSKRISVIDFWHTKCGVCYPNNEYLNTEANKYKNLGVDFYLVYMGDIDSFEKFQSSARNSKWKNLIHLYDPENAVSKLLELYGAPHTLIVSNGKFLYHQAGYSDESESLEAEKLNEIIMQEVHNNTDLKTLVPGIKNTIDLGEINIRYDSLQTFRLQNTFPEPLYIQDVKGSCNCIVSDWTKDAIMSNDYGSISFKLISDGNSENNKTLMIATSSSRAPYTTVNLSYKIDSAMLKDKSHIQ